MCSEKSEIIDEAEHLIRSIKQMEPSLVDERRNGQYQLDLGDLSVTFPLNRCLASLQEKHAELNKLLQERFKQVKS